LKVLFDIDTLADVDSAVDNTFVVVVVVVDGKLVVVVVVNCLVLALDVVTNTYKERALVNVQDKQLSSSRRSAIWSVTVDTNVH